MSGKHISAPVRHSILSTIRLTRGKCHTRGVGSVLRGGERRVIVCIKLDALACLGGNKQVDSITTITTSILGVGPIVGFNIKGLSICRGYHKVGGTEGTVVSTVGGRFRAGFGRTCRTKGLCLVTTSDSATRMARR